MNRLFLLAIPVVLMLLVSAIPQSAFAWDFGSLFNGFNGFHHWGFNNYGQFGCGAYCQGERDAIFHPFSFFKEFNYLQLSN